MKRILFVDLRNTARSQMAEAWFNEFAAGWAKAQSCGTMPAVLIDPSTVHAMKEAGIEMQNAQCKPMHMALLVQADIVIAMGADVKLGAFHPSHVWDFQDPTGKELEHYRIQRDAIRTRVQELVVELQCKHFDSERTDWIHPALLQRELMTRYMLHP